MKPISDERIRETFGYYEGSQVQKSGDGWIVMMSSGRTVNIHPYHIDFRGITKRLPGEAERDRDDLQFELMTLAQEELGIVSLISCHGKHRGEGGTLWLYGKCYKLNVEGPWWPFSSTQVQRFFADHATRKLRLGGYRINAGKGMSAVISFNPNKELMVTKIVGGSEILEAAILLVHDVQGYVIASGSRDNILSCLAHGETLNVEVIPELYISHAQYRKIGTVAGGLCGLPGLFIGLTNNNIGQGVLIGAALSIIASTLYSLVFQRNSRKRARERGQTLKSNYPARGKRQSNIDDARRKGML